MDKKFDTVSCLICNCEIAESSQSKDPDDQNKSKSSCYLRKVWDVFCRHLHLENPSNFDDILTYFGSGNKVVPFCSTCKNEIESMYMLHEQIEKLKGQLGQVTSNLSSTIVQTTIKASEAEAEGNSHQDLKPKNAQNNKKKKINNSHGIQDKIIKMRQQIAKYYSSADFPINNEIPKKSTKAEVEATTVNKVDTSTSDKEELTTIIKTEVTTNEMDMKINPVGSSRRSKRKISTKHLYNDIYYGDIPLKEEVDDEIKIENNKTTPPKRIKKNSTSPVTANPVKMKVEKVSPKSEVKERRRLMEWTVTADKGGKKSYLFDGKWPVSTVIVSTTSGEEMRLQCNSCGAKRRRKPDMTAHIKLRHIDSARYVCDVCSKVCHNLSHLKWHKATHKTTCSFTCPVSGCRKRYKDKIQLVQHIKVFHGQKKEVKEVKPIESDVIVNMEGEAEEEYEDEEVEEEEEDLVEEEGELEEEDEYDETEEQEEEEEEEISAPLPQSSSSGLVILSCKTVSENNTKKTSSKNTDNNDNDEDDVDIPPCAIEEGDDGEGHQMVNEIQVDGLEDGYNEAFDGVPPSMPILIPVHFPSSSSSPTITSSTITSDTTPTTNASRHKKWKPLDETGQKSFLYDDQWLVSTVINPSGELQYYCETCGAKRKRKADMTSHIRLTHLQPLKYVCRFCAKVCYHGGHLKWHEATHTQTPNKCSVENCGKVFKSQNHLALHMKTHVIASRRAKINNTNNNTLPPPSPEFPSYGEFLERQENDMDLDSLEDQKKEKGV